MSKLEIIHSNHCVHSIGLHLIWCTKYRHSVLVNGVDSIVKQTIVNACLTYGWKCHAIEVMPDYVHCFIQYPPTEAANTISRTLKSLSAVAVFCSFPKLKGQKFWGSGLWSPSCYYGSVGAITQDAVQKYIEEQKSK